MFWEEPRYALTSQSYSDDDKPGIFRGKDEYDKWIGDIKGATGVELKNPYDEAVDPGYFLNQEDAFRSQVNELAKKHPDKLDILRPDRDPRSEDFKRFDELFQSSVNENDLNHSFIGKALSIDRAYQTKIDAIKKATGEELTDPLNAANDPETGFYNPERYAQAQAEFQRRLYELADKYPEMREIIGPDRPLIADANQLRARTEHRDNEAWDKSAQDAAAWLARLGGGFYSMTHDPVQVGTAFAGPWGHAARGIKGLLWMGLKQGAANAGAEALMQPFVQQWRKEAGLDYGVGQAARDIGMAGAFGFAVDAGVRGLVRGGRRAAGKPYLGPPDAPHGARLPGAPEQAESAQSGPGPAARPDNPLSALDQAARSAPEGSLIRRAFEGDETALREMAQKTGVDADPAIKRMLEEVETQKLFPAPERVDDGEHMSALARAVREASGSANDLPAGDAIKPAVARDIARIADEAAREAVQIEGKAVGFRSLDPRKIEADPDVFQFKSGGNNAGVTDRLRGVTRWDPISAGKAIVFERADGQMVIADGHQRRDLALRATAKGEDAKLDAYVFRERDGWTAEDVRAYAALKNMRESSGTSLDMANVMRERPDLIDGSLPLTDAKLREAVMLSRLSPVAFDAVQAGRLPPAYAAMVGESVADASRHIGLVEELADAKLQSAQQARLYLKQLMELPTTVEIQHTLFGEESFTRTVLLERTKVLDSALKSLRADKRVFSLLQREAKTIEGVGNVLARDVNAAQAESAAQLAELIEKLATSRGTVATILNDAAASVARGYNATLASRAFVARIGDILEKEGIPGLLKTEEAVAPDLSPRMMDNPAGPEAAVQTQELFDILTADGLADQARQIARAMSTPEPRGAVDASHIAEMVAERMPQLLSEALPALAAMPEFNAIASDLGKMVERIAKKPEKAPQIAARELPKLLEKYGLSQDVESAIGGVFSGGDAALAKLMSDIAGLAEDAMFAIRGYHGTPHEFDRFDLSKIGTGEGAQAFGHGLYFAENAAVAKDYAANVTSLHQRYFLNGMPIDADRDFRLDRAARAKLSGDLDSLERDAIATRDTPELEAIARVRAGEVATQKSGQIYEVSIDVEPHQLLDWDKHIADQSGLQEKLEPIARELLGGEDNPRLLKALVGTEPGKFYSEMINHYGSAEAASARLREAGIPGIRYADQGSRGAERALYKGNPVGSEDAPLRYAAAKLEQHGTPEKALAAMREEAKKGGWTGSDTFNQAEAYLNSGDLTFNDITRNFVIFDDSLVKITHKNGEPITAAERADALEQMHGDQAAAEESKFALRGFYSPAIRAAESISQAKGTGEQYWKQITKNPGVKKDELDWMGLEEFLKGKASITKAEVLDFMRAHQVMLDEKVLGDTMLAKKELAPLAASQVPPGVVWSEDWFEQASKIWSYRIADEQYYITHGAEGWGIHAPDGQVMEGEPANLAQAQHMVDGIHASMYDDEGLTKFHDYKVPGGENYRELLIRLPGLGGRDKTAAESARIAELNAEIIDRQNSGDLDAAQHFESERDEIIKGAAAKYTSKHFQDQEIVHLRVDDRTGPNGEKVLFVNEVQSDLHQGAQGFGYGTEGASKAAEALNNPLSEAERARMNDLEGQLSEALARSAPDDESVRLFGEIRELENKAAKTKERARKYINTFGEHGAPKAPLKGDLWLELALKRALLYASENGYDAVSWSRSDQIAKAVGADVDDLKLHYDSKIGKFLDKYTKKWGGKVEEIQLADMATNSAEQAKTRLEKLAAEFDGKNDAYSATKVRELASYPGTSVDGILARAKLGNQLVYEKVSEALGDVKGEVNPILRITPEMRASVMEGQPLALPNEGSGRPATLHNSTLSQRASAQMADIRAEIDKAVSRSLPVGWRAEVRQSLVFGDLSEGIRKRNPSVPPSLEIEGTFDPYERIIYVSMAALDPVERTFEEAGHALKAMRLIPEADYGILQAKALEIGARERFKIDERYGDVYGARWKDDPARLEAALEEEAIMQMVAARARGEDFSKPANAILDKVLKFFRAVRDMLTFRNFRSFEDVFEDMTEGGFARKMDEQAVPRADDAMASLSDDIRAQLDEIFDKFNVKSMADLRRIKEELPRDWKAINGLSGQMDKLEIEDFNRHYGEDYEGPVGEFPSSPEYLAVENEYNKLLAKYRTDDYSYLDVLDSEVKADLKRAEKLAAAMERRGIMLAVPPRLPSADADQFLQKATLIGEAMFALGDNNARTPGGKAARQIRDLINGAAARGEMSREDADALIKRYEALERQHKDAGAAKQQLAKELDAEAAHRKRQKGLSEIARKRVETTLLQFRDARGQADPAKAMVAMIENLGQHELPEGTLSVANHQHAIFGLAMADLDDMLNQFRKTIITGQTRNKAGLSNVVRELFGEKTGDVSAQAFAQSAAGTMEKLRQRFNAAGGAIGQRADWGLPQWHDQAALIRGGREAWKKYITPLLDPERMKHPLTGNAMTPEDLKTSLDWIYDNIVSDGWHEKEAQMAFHGLGTIANQRGDHRFLVFKDADSWMKYAEQFGNGSDPLAVIVNHIKGMTKDIAAMEVLGPNPRAMLTYMQQFVQQQAERRRGGLPSVFPAQTEVTGRDFRPFGSVFLSRDPRNYAQRMIERADNMWDLYRGNSGGKVGDKLAEVSQTVRNLNVVTKLGSATISALTDPFWQLAARKFAGLPATGIIGDVVRQIAVGGEQEARRAGVIADTYLHMHNVAAREGASLSATGISGYLADRVISLSMLNGLTRAGNHAMAMGIQGFLADQTAKSFRELDGPIQRLLRRHGLAEADWNAIRLDASGAPVKTDFLTPSAVRQAVLARGGDTQLAERYLAMTLTESQYATATGTLRAQAMTFGNTKAGTGVGEMWRHLAQFKSFAVNMAILQIERMAREFVSQGLWRGAQYGTYALMSATLGGALVIQIKQLLAGKDPRDMSKPEFWANSLYQSGGLSIWGDLLYASENRFGGGIAGTIAGPTASSIQDLANLTYGAASKRLVGTEKEDTNYGREIAKGIRNYTPGGSLWYLRTAWNRVLMDNLQRTLDPKADAAFRRQIQKSKKDYKQDWWWTPGKPTPSRAPSVRALLPAK